MKKVLGVLFLAAVTSGCAMTSFTSANTVKPDTVSIFAGTGGISLEGQSTDVPGMDLGVRFGITENIDMGIRPFLLGLYGDLKWALFQSRNFGPSLALDVGLGYSSFLGLNMYAIDVGPIFSFKLGKIMNPYILAKYRTMGTTYQAADYSGENPLDGALGSFIIATVGVEFLPDAIITPTVEVSQFFNTEGEAAIDLFIYNFAIKLNF